MRQTRAIFLKKLNGLVSGVSFFLKKKVHLEAQFNLQPSVNSTLFSIFRTNLEALANICLLILIAASAVLPAMTLVATCFISATVFASGTRPNLRLASFFFSSACFSLLGSTLVHSNNQHAAGAKRQESQKCIFFVLYSVSKVR